MTGTQIFITVCGAIIVDCVVAAYCIVRARGVYFRATRLGPLSEEEERQVWRWTRRADILFPFMRMTTKTGWRE